MLTISEERTISFVNTRNEVPPTGLAFNDNGAVLALIMLAILSGLSALSVLAGKAVINKKKRRR